MGAFPFEAVSTVSLRRMLGGDVKPRHGGPDLTSAVAA